MGPGGADSVKSWKYNNGSRFMSSHQYSRQYFGYTRINVQNSCN